MGSCAPRPSRGCVVWLHGKLVVESGRVAGEIIHLVLALASCSLDAPGHHASSHSLIGEERVSGGSTAEPIASAARRASRSTAPDLLAHGAVAEAAREARSGAYAYFRALARPFEPGLVARFPR